MSYQVKKKGGSVVMVDIDSVDSKQRESYVGAIEPYTTVARLHELQAFNKLHADEHRVLRMQEEYGMTVKRTSSIRKRETEKIDSKAFSKTRTGYRMPKKSEKTVEGKHEYPKPKSGTVPVMMTDKSSTEQMMTKKKTTTYNVKDLKRLQILETEISMRKPILADKKTSQAQRRKTLIDIAHHKSEINKITKGTHKTGSDIAKDREKGRIIVVDDEGNVY